jgi:hypothetical protein
MGYSAAGKAAACAPWYAHSCLELEWPFARCGQAPCGTGALLHSDLSPFHSCAQAPLAPMASWGIRALGR